MLQSFVIFVLGKEGERADGTVNFRCHYALRKKPAGHTHRVVFPVFHQTVDGERGEERNVVLFQIFHHGVAHASVCHVDNGIRSDFTDELHEPGERRDRIHVVSRLFECFNQFRGIRHLSGDHNLACPLFIESVFAEKLFIIGHV